MLTWLFACVCVIAVSGLKTWIPNTSTDNKYNWDLQRVPQDCDNVILPLENDLSLFWKFSSISISGLSLSSLGVLIFPQDVNIKFSDIQQCSSGKDITFTRVDAKGWLDPENWMSDSDSSWLPHSERIPCAGEKVEFPGGQSLAVQLPTIMSPMGIIHFDGRDHDAESWKSILSSELGFEQFKGELDMRLLRWRSDPGCFNRKTCLCGRGPYAIRDLTYRDTSTKILEEAVCLYAKERCVTPKCYSPIRVEGHCCEICGAVVTLEDNTLDGIDINDIKEKVLSVLKKSADRIKISVHTRRVSNGNIEVMLVAKDDGDTLDTITFAGLLKDALKTRGITAAISSKHSGLTLSSYVFNRTTGVFFGTLLSIVALFTMIFYIYIVLPKKKLIKLVEKNPFTFIKFDNTMQGADSEEHLEIGTDAGSSGAAQAFDNPMYSEPSTSKSEPKIDNLDSGCTQNIEETKDCKEYENPVYTELEKADHLDIFEEKLEPESKGESLELFSDIDL